MRNISVHSWRSALLAWYDRGHRQLPWRQEPPQTVGGADPWKVWVSEIMLQQTPVARVVPYFQKFIKRFPAAGALAVASEAEALSYWSGLGYYSRLRNLRAGAAAVTDRLRRGGGYPRTAAEWREIPGIGAYTAAAITSIAFGEAVPVIDGNVRRVAARLRGRRIADGEVRRRLASAIDASRPGDFNQALMELGATVCRPERPLCDRCPLGRFCNAYAEGRPEQIAVTRARRQTTILRAVAYVIEGDGKVLLVKRTQSRKGLLLPTVNIGLWEPPTFRRTAGSDAETVLRETLGIKLANRRKLSAEIKHTITHHRISVAIVRTTVVRRPAMTCRTPTAAWVRLDSVLRAASTPLTGLARKVLSSVSS
ncbi:MAG: A/G-specific adenine glycosylase [Acidobacteria bacterium]|nr:A/G-specific adenine glycosylase [Acidobacteriota bacterium]